MPSASTASHISQLLVPIQIELLKDTIANYPPGDCSDSPRNTTHHFPVILSSCPVSFCVEHDRMLGCLAPPSVVTGWAVESWDPLLVKERS
jgi:hypothetical protein